MFPSNPVATSVIMKPGVIYEVEPTCLSVALIQIGNQNGSSNLWIWDYVERLSKKIILPVVDTVFFFFFF